MRGRKTSRLTSLKRAWLNQLFPGKFFSQFPSLSLSFSLSLSPISDDISSSSLSWTSWITSSKLAAIFSQVCALARETAGINDCCHMVSGKNRDGSVTGVAPLISLVQILNSQLIYMILKCISSYVCFIHLFHLCVESKFAYSAYSWHFSDFFVDC